MRDLILGNKVLRHALQKMYCRRLLVPSQEAIRPDYELQQERYAMIQARSKCGRWVKS